MAELDAITETLRRQRKDIAEQMDRTVSRGGQAADLVDRIEDLRRRSEDAQRRFEVSAEQNKAASKSRRGK